MSKRLSTSTAQNNTILNYFQSPKGKQCQTPKKTTTEKEEVKRLESDDDSPIQIKKRKKSSVIDSSDSSNEENTPVKPTPKKRKGKAAVKSDSDSDYSQSEEDSDNGKPAKKSKQGPKTIPKSAQNGTTSKDENVKGTHTNWLHNRLEFLQPNQIRDKEKRKPSDPDYDPRTLYVPQTFLDKQTPAMRQWWILKSDHMDSVIFFKVGKFYELYHMDATVGVTELGFSYMKGEFAHSGFPETAYHKMAVALLEKGYKVARSEQTETPEMMAERCKKIKSTKFDRVVNREICQISTKATCVYSAQLPEARNPLSCYLFAISEKDSAPNSKVFRFGICFVDTSIGVFHMAEVDDDKYCSKLLAIFAENPPGLILTERKMVSPKLKEILSTTYKDIRKDTLASDSQFYSATRTIEKLMSGNYFRDKQDRLNLPVFLSSIIDGYNPKPGFELALKSLGACMWYLEDSKLDIQVISMGKFEPYLEIKAMASDDITAERSAMILDSNTIENLNLLLGEGSLQRTVDRCNTTFGRRLLQQWICRPLCSVTKIKERQSAVEELYKQVGTLKEAQDIFKKLPDLERQCAKIHTYGNRFFAKDHPDSRAIFYEAATYSKRRINDLLSTLRGFEKAQEFIGVFKDCKAPLLKKLTQVPPLGNNVDLSESLLFFKNAFNQDQAQSEGKIIPKAGVDESYDQAEDAIAEINRKLSRYLEEQCRFFQCKVTYFGNDKKRFQIDVPDTHNSRVNEDYHLEGTKKGAKPSKRYTTPQTKQLLADMMKAESERSKIVQDLNRRIFEKFSDRHEQWDQAIGCLAELDVLCSLAEYARSFSQDVCIPDILPISKEPKLVLENGRHPCISNIDTFVPNDTKMGVDNNAPILVITGPNMGGKSTLMRQVAIISIMAQMGGYVPASACQLNLIDRIFTRLGANDDIIQGQSTFLVELSEASTILKYATPFSLVLLDELGRGTSTHDGNAIATAYVQKLTQIQCRTLFSTHYHSLVDHFIGRSDVQLGHMACMVENDEDPTEESVTFLYKMAQGRCPKSYGFNVAKLAGLKQSVIAGGREIAKELESEAKSQQVYRKLRQSHDLSTIRKLLLELSL